MKKNIIILVSFLFSALLFTNTYAQTGDMSMNEALVEDPNVTIGTLNNGLKYYIRENQKPENRVEMRLVIRAGSLQEDDQQQGLAHFVEHMCFNGTKNFEKNELIDFLELMGIRFGSGLNAYTSFGETVYKLQIPTDDEELLNKGYQVLEDWAHNVSFEPEEIDKERGVIIEEWRTGLSADDRMRKEYMPVILQGSRYAERMPIGKVDILKNFRHETLIQYYKDWYRPELMAVIVVGDIDAAKAKEKIAEHFGQLQNPANGPKHIDYEIPDNTEPLIAIATDKEATMNGIMVFYKHKHKVPKTLSDFRETLKHEIYNGMINDRLKEITYLQNAPFTNAYMYYGSFLGRSSDAYMARAVSKENQIEQSLERLLVENQRVKKFGFTETEFTRQMAKIMRQYETALAEKDKTESRRFINEYVNNYLSEDPIPGIENEMKYMMKVLRWIQLDEINKLAWEWITDDNMVILVTAPDKDGVTVPDQAKILQIIAESKTKEIEAYIDRVNEDPLMKEKPKGTEIVKSLMDDGADVMELEFENGVKVVLKPTKFKNDEVLFSAYSLGGHSLSYVGEDFYSALFADDVVRISGVGDYNKVLLDKKLSDKIVSVRPYIDELKQGFSGKCSPKDLETLLQLVHLYFVQPNHDRNAFKVWKEKATTRYQNMLDNPTMLFYDTLYKTVSNNNPRTMIIPKVSQIDQVDFEMLHNFYGDRFSDASGFTFFLVGNFDIKRITPMLQSYLGGLPAKESEETWNNVDIPFPDGITELTLKKGLEDKSMVAIVMSNSYDYSKEYNLTIKMMMKILSNKLRESMREDQSGVYGVRAAAQTSQYPETECKVFVNWGCNPDNVDKLSATVFDEMNKIKEGDIEKEDLIKAVEIFIRERETNLEKNKFWIKEMESSYYDNLAPGFDLEAYKRMVQSVTLEEIQAAANMFFTTDNYVKAVLMPEKGGKAPKKVGKAPKKGKKKK